jgi:predicted ATPase
MIKEESQIEPLLVVIEDAHWIDPSTQEFIQRLAICLNNMSVLLVITSRDTSNFEMSDFALPHTHNISIEQLKRSDCFKLLESLCEKEKLPVQLSEQIVNQTDGVPLFIEDVILSLLQSSQLSSGSLVDEKIAVPNKLSEHLMSRIDDLGESKQVAQLAAVIGREFSLFMLQALSNLTTSKLEMKIDRLVDAGLILLSGRTEDQRYVFKHSMIRDAAYESLLISDRMELHSRIASWIETESAIQRQTQPETIAYHYELAGAFDLS